jgi:hypothetical protein
MAFEHEKRQALRILEGIENGSASAAESFQLIEEADPTLVYFIFTWLRSNYADHPAAEGVIGRVVEICSRYPAVTAQVKAGEADSVVTWFKESHRYRDLDSTEFIDLIIEKLEG